MSEQATDTIADSPSRHGEGSPSIEFEFPMPPIAFGTYRMHGYQCFDAVQEALDVGYRHIDTAMAYQNEAVIGRAIESFPIDRDDVFVTTKIKGYPRFMKYDRLIEAVEGCLQRLGMDYIDLLLIHWWNSRSDMEETMLAMNDLVDAGLVNHVGVSNFSVEQLERAVGFSEAPILTNQVEYNPYVDQDELLAFCRANDIILSAYSPLAVGRVVNDDTLCEIGERYGKSAAQVSLRWLIQQENVVPLPKSSSPLSIRENLDVFDFTLDEQDMARIHELKGPLWFRLNGEDGSVTKFRSRVGPYVPREVRQLVGKFSNS